MSTCTCLHRSVYESIRLAVPHTHGLIRLPCLSSKISCAHKVEAWKTYAVMSVALHATTTCMHEYVRACVRACVRFCEKTKQVFVAMRLSQGLMSVLTLKQNTTLDTALLHSTQTIFLPVSAFCANGTKI